MCIVCLEMENCLKAPFGRQWPLLGFTSLIISLLYLMLTVLDKVTPHLCSIMLKSTRNVVKPLGMCLENVQFVPPFETVGFLFTFYRFFSNMFSTLNETSTKRDCLVRYINEII